MSDIKFNCPHCGQSLEAPEEMQGQRIECPSCDGSIQLPEQQKQVQSGSGTKKKVIIKSKISTSQLSSNMVFCRGCGEKIHKTAQMCPHCGAPTINKQPSRIATGTIVCAYILAIIAPLFGLIAGIYLLFKEKTLHGITTVIISIFVALFSVFWWLNVYS